MPDSQGVWVKNVCASVSSPTQTALRRCPLLPSAKRSSVLVALSLGLRQSKFGSYLQVYGIFACFFWSPNFFLHFVIFSLMLIVELRRLWGGALFRNIHETTMEWSECGAAPAVSERGTSLAPGRGTRWWSLVLFRCCVLRWWQLVDDDFPVNLHADLKPYS